MTIEATLLRIVEIYYTALSLIGLAINIWAYIDGKIDLKSLINMKVNGILEKTAKIGLRSALATIFTHTIFAVLGIISLFRPAVNTTSIYSMGLSVGFPIVACILMSYIVCAQTLNQIDRVWIRNNYISRERIKNAER